MADQLSDFLEQSRTLAQQSWETWMRQLQGAPMTPSAPAAPMWPGSAGPVWPQAAAPGNMGYDMFERGMSGIKSYMDGLQQAAMGQGSAMGGDWTTQLQQMLGGGGQAPFLQAFQGIDSKAAQGFVTQWQSWVSQLAKTGAGPFNAMSLSPQMPAFGLNREQQAQQQALVTAMMESVEQQRRYHALILRANADGLERLQGRLAKMTDTDQAIDSWKALYDLWVDTAEQAYNEIALSEEFGEIYGAMVNAQMRERQLQQQQLEQFCRMLGLPTRSEVDSLGQRVQELRRQQARQPQPQSEALRRATEPSRRAASTDDHTDAELALLRSEIDDLKQKLKETKSSKAAVKKPALKKAAARKAVKTSKSARPAAKKAAKSNAKSSTTARRRT